MVDCPDCPVRLRGLSTPGADGGPTILKRTDQEFLQAVLDELSAEDGLASIAGSVATIPAGEPVLKLFQPVHRTFNLATLEIYCDVFGEPRLDPRRIESAGLVVRRVYVDPAARTSPLSRRLSARKQKAQQLLSGGREIQQTGGSEMSGRGNLAPTLSSAMTLAVREQTTAPVGVIDAGAEQLEGWMKSRQALQGWVPLAPAQLDQDPDPARRRAPLRAGLPLIDALLSATGQVPLEENVAPLFVAPPEVCRATGKTVLYGLIPVISSELSETPDTMPPFPDDAVIAHLSGYLLPGTPPPLPRAGQVIGVDAADAADLAPFVTMLRQLAIELDAFGVTPAATALYAELNQVLLPFTPATLNATAAGNSDVAAILNMGSQAQVSGVAVFQVRAGEYLRSLSPILLERQDLQSLLPDAWPEIGQDQGGRLLAAIKAAMTARLAVVAPREGRYDDLGRQYRARAFVRVKGENGCPPTVIWSDVSERFTIAAWYESGDAPPAQIHLPDVTDRDFLKKLKPNVSFIMPESLFNMLQGDPKKLQQGEGSAGGVTVGLQWICSFSIPIITLVAFIVLYIFLTLFDLIFSWLLFIKICIPFPKISRSG